MLDEWKLCTLQLGLQHGVDQVFKRTVVFFVYQVKLFAEKDIMFQARVEMAL